MSTATIIVAIVSLLGILVSYAFVQQTIKNKQEQKYRLIQALKARSRSFKFMLNGFPTGFLTKELSLLVQRGLADVSEQLSKLDPNDPQHLQDFQLITAQINDNQRRPPTAPGSVSVENPQQIKDIKASLEELNKFVHKLEEKRVVARNQAQLYKSQIRQMVLQVSIDSYCMNGKTASQAGKTKLAIHHFETALNLIVRESKSDVFKNKVTWLKESIASLRGRLADEQATMPVSSKEQAEKEEIDGEWDKFSEKDDHWKKKNIYD